MNVNMSNLKTVLLDMDGVLWRGTEPILKIGKLFEQIKQKGLNVICITNNSARTVEYYIQRLSKYGVDLGRDQIITSAEASGTYLIERFPQGGSIYIVGEEGLIETLKRRTFPHIENPNPANVLAVVAGLDRNLTYQKLACATHLISSGVLFIGTNPDKSIPIPEGIAPGAGSIIGAIENATGIKARIIGKPAKYLFELALNRANCAPQEAIMIGDRLDTDIAGAQSVGIRTGLVLSGVTKLDQALNWVPALDIIANNATEILEKMN